MSLAATCRVLLALNLLHDPSFAFVAVTPPSSNKEAVQPSTAVPDELVQQKARLLGLIRVQPSEDPVLADPFTKEGLVITTQSTLIAGAASRVKFQLQSPSNTFTGSSDRFINLLEPVSSSSSSEETEQASSSASPPPFLDRIIKSATPFLPTPLRSALATAGLPMGVEYVPMRDLFTSPSVSFAYERGWRQGFAQAGFPGADREAEMAMDYFSPAMTNSQTKVLVDMSCATGLFTRRFAKSGNYNRALGCDYSESMLVEARRRIERDPQLRSSRMSRRRHDAGKKRSTRLDLVRLDVGRIPMKNCSVDAMNAGAAMHCWPDLPAAVSEIYRVLKPGGRYFATTFLSAWFGMLQNAEGGAAGPSRQAFQYFKSVEQLRDLLESGGFESDKIVIEVLGAACVVIRCEK